jgi:predicted O-methyltransferase YrrM
MKKLIIPLLEELIAEGLKEELSGDSWLDSRYNEQPQLTPYYNLFRILGEQLEPSFIVELGSYQGTAAAHFAYGAKDAIVVTIDSHECGQIHDEIKKTVEAANHYPNLHYIHKWTRDAGPDVQKLSQGRTIDILYVDAGHEAENIQREWVVYEPMLSDEALVIFDDVQGGFPGVVHFWNETKGRKILDTKLHSGIPMGFLIFERKNYVS